MDLSEARNDLIFDDVLCALEEGRSPVVITERTAHLETIAKRLEHFARHVVVLRGGQREKPRRDIAAPLSAIPHAEERVIHGFPGFGGQADALRDIVRDYALETLADEAAVLDAVPASFEINSRDHPYRVNNFSGGISPSIATIERSGLTTAPQIIERCEMRTSQIGNMHVISHACTVGCQCGWPNCRAAASNFGELS